LLLYPDSDPVKIQTRLKTFLSISVYCLLFALLSISWLPLQKQNNLPADYSTVEILSPDSSKNKFIIRDEIAYLYHSLELREKGLSFRAFEYACKGYYRLLQKKMIDEQAYLVICDFSQSSGNKRMYLVDMANCRMVVNTYVAHGRNSGGEYARRFSNRPKSLQSSLGFYITKNTYYGEHGLSLRMAGLEKGYNDRALQRRIVMHGADYIGEKWLQNSKAMGRSYGCPALPKKESEPIINMIKNGSCVFIYHPSSGYLNGSKILND